MKVVLQLVTLLRVVAKVGPWHAWTLLVLSQRSARSRKLRIKGYARPVVIRGRSSDAWILNQILISEEYKGYVKTSPRRILDAGANIGMASLYFHRHFPDAEIVAIEPDPDTFGVLSANTAHLPDVTRIRAGLWSHDTRLSVRYPNAEKYAIEVFEDPAKGTVEAFSVSSIMERMGWDHIDVVKMDVEGSEAVLLADPDAPWLDRIDTLIIEIHQDTTPGVARVLFKAFADRDFHLRWRGENLVLSKIRKHSPEAVV